MIVVSFFVSERHIQTNHTIGVNWHILTAISARIARYNTRQNIRITIHYDSNYCSENLKRVILAPGIYLFQCRPGNFCRPFIILGTQLRVSLEPLGLQHCQGSLIGDSMGDYYWGGGTLSDGCTRGWSTHREIFSKSYWIKFISNCIYHFPIDFEQQTDTVRFWF